MGRGRWKADRLRDLVRDYVVEHLADEDAVLVIDETGFLKQGKASCYGLGREDYELPDRSLAAYVSRHAHAFIDRELYLPKIWTGDKAPVGRGACAGRHRFCDQARACADRDRPDMRLARRSPGSPPIASMALTTSRWRSPRG